MGCSASIVLPLGDQPFENINFLQSSMRNIDRYLYLLHKNIQLDRATDETVHIRDGVEKCVRSLIKLTYLKDSRFLVDDDQLLKVGSIYEGTKIGVADQFDYIVVMSELDEYDIMIEDHNYPINGIDVKVCVKLNEYLGDRRTEYKEFLEMWTDITDKPYVIGKKTKNNNKSGLLDIFEKCVRKVSVFVSPFRTRLGTLEIDRSTRIRKEGPSVRITLKWTKEWFVIEESRRIDKTSTESIIVNITPAIKVNEITPFVSPNDPMNTAIHEKMLERGFFLLIPNFDGHFKKVFTHMEVDLIKELPARHIKAFCVLKFLINGNKRAQNVKAFKTFDFMLYDSFALKMLMLELSDTCPCLNHTEFELFDCVNHVLQKMYRNLYEVRDGQCEIHPNVFIQSSTYTFYNNDRVRLNRTQLSELIKQDLKVSIGERERYEFNGSTKMFGLLPLNSKILASLKALNSK